MAAFRSPEVTVEPRWWGWDTSLQTLVRDSAVPVVIIERSGKVCFVNSASERLFGCGAASLIGKSFNFPLELGSVPEFVVQRADGEMLILQAHVGETYWKDGMAYLVTMVEAKLDRSAMAC
jgi:PAS domain-containing protein